MKEGKGKTKNYTWRRTVEKERAKQSWVEELGSTSGCTKRKCSGQTAWRPYAPTSAMRLDDDDGDCYYDKPSMLFISICHHGH